MALKDDSPSAPLSTLDENEYVVAFGPNGRQFCATPNGYSAMFLPHQALTLLSQARKVTWASFGSHPDSWFFLFEDEHGNPGYTYGKEIPETLKAVFADRGLGLLRPLSSLRLQLGANDSFVIWDRYKWLCNNLPNLLRAHLCQISSSVTKGDNNTTTGYFKSESLALTNITWHDSGSFYMKWGDEHSWNYQSHIMRQAWNSLWQEYEDGVLTSRELSDLAFVAIDPHASEADTVVFIKKKQGDGEANFAIHFPNEPVITRLELPERSTSTTTSKPPEDTIIPDDRLEYAAQVTSQEVTYQFAKSKKSGRPHPKDSWELDLRKGETIKILQERGREWYIIENKRGIKGFAHRSWLELDEDVRAEPKTAYTRFKGELEMLLVPGQLTYFPRMADYMDVCAKPDCTLLKQGVHSLGICIHDLQVLLQGSGSFSFEWLKEQRVVWHPDKFARYCHPDHRDQLKVKAERLFVMFSALMDTAKSL